MSAQPTTRLPDAATRLAALVRQRHNVPFAWGVSDCAMLAFDATLAATGRDPIPDLRGCYTTGAQAMRLLRRLGGFAGLLRARYGSAVSWADAQDGDPVLLRAGVCTGTGEGQGALGFKWGDIVVAQGGDGLVSVDRSAVAGAWRAA